jgi:hypothetical protein
VRLLPRGIDKLSRKLGVTQDELSRMLADLSRKLKDELKPTGLPADPGICEDDERYSFEADFMGNVTLRDTKTGKTRYLQGDDGQKFLHEIDRVGNNYQPLIQPYFDERLVEFVEEDVASDEMGNTGGTYNFPFNGNFACARFWLAGTKPMVEVVSVVDADGEELPLDARTKAEADRVAWEWVNKV